MVIYVLCLQLILLSIVINLFYGFLSTKSVQIDQPLFVLCLWFMHCNCFSCTFLKSFELESILILCGLFNVCNGNGPSLHILKQSISIMDHNGA